MKRSVWALTLAGLACAAGLFAAEKDSSRVFDPPKQPDDIRLKLDKYHHVDNPAPFTADFKSKEDWEKRAYQLRTQVLVATGLHPFPNEQERPALKPVVHGKIDRDEYTIEKVFFASLPGHYVCGNLYRPKANGGREPTGGKLPAVLCPHGHWANGRLYERGEAEAKKEMASGAEKTMESARYPLQARCAMLARMGCVVFFYDMVGNADSKALPHTAGYSDAKAELWLQSPMGLQTWNSVRALDFLCGLPDVDAKRVAVTGASGGGTQTFLLCAVDPRPAVSFPAVMVSTKMQGGCICENCSLLRVGTNNIELAALFAPKPQAMTGANDWTREIETLGLPELKKIYGLYGAEDKVDARYFNFGHNYNQVSREYMYNWVNKHLKLGHKEPIAEKPFKPVPPKELSVFNAEHPLPKDSADMNGVRDELTRAATKRMLDLPIANYRGIVRAGLQAMVNDSVPEKVDFVQGTTKEDKRDGYMLHKAVLTREGSGMQVPAIGLVPDGFNGQIVIWTHAGGKTSLFNDNGTVADQAKLILDAKMAILSGDLFMTGEFQPPDQPMPAPFLEQKYHKNVPFTGYMYGYNRSLLAERVRDILTLTSFAKNTLKAKSVHIVALGKTGPAALAARVLAGDAIDRAAIDLAGFDFNRVTDTKDEMMLPGALKYGGVMGFASACPDRPTTIVNPPKDWSTTGYMKALPKEVKVAAGPVDANELVRAVLK